jgi:hypothetical protein
MFHPLESDLTDLKDKEVEDKVLELTKKYYTAARLGNPDLLTQISTFITIYKSELSRRYMQRSNGQDKDDLDQLINVD